MYVQYYFIKFIFSLKILMGNLWTHQKLKFIYLVLGAGLKTYGDTIYIYIWSRSLTLKEKV